MSVEPVQAKSICQLYGEAEHEEVVLWSDCSSGYRGIIAIHSTTLGPAVGGTRFWNYECEKAASLDALRLSKAMSYKNALAGLPFGGGKAVVFKSSNEVDREKIFRAHGRFIQSLNGRFITGEDVGTRPTDMKIVRTETSWVAGLPEGAGDPSPLTALGVFRAMEASAKHRWGSSSLAGKRVAIQGCGGTGYYLAQKLHQAGASLVATDIDESRLQRVVQEFDATPVAPEAIYEAEVDIFAPCALGGVINNETVNLLRSEMVVGSANNQLLADEHGETLARRGILFAPDCVANSGGMINGCRDLLGWDVAQVERKIDAIYDRTLSILEMSETEKLPPNQTAERLARSLISLGHSSSRPL